ncbi:MAG: polyprenyl synthetase family protein [Clostridia bacterium]|nr:polyprenyl synthetase family protein [Clostridia bacterium]
MNFQKQFDRYRKMVNDGIDKVFYKRECLQKSVYDAMTYSVKAGGKRIRPVLALAVGDMLGADLEDVLKIGVAIECIHTYSLIHDDLPCMDNDDLRRGMPTCHKKFGEATALLAGDGLLTMAFELLTDFSAFKTLSAETVLKAAQEITKAAGCAGMIGGQVVDLESEGSQDVTEETLTYMHNRKTGALIRVSVLAGAIAAGADEKKTGALIRFADGIGLAFQVQDDILDCTGNADVLGKPIGSDAENEKTTYVTLLGLDNARTKAEELTQNAIAALECFDEKAKFLKEFAKYLMGRKN